MQGQSRVQNILGFYEHYHAILNCVLIVEISSTVIEFKRLISKLSTFVKLIQQIKKKKKFKI